jgi:hypothetical protein
MTTAPLFTSRAVVVTHVPGRYAKQLVSHLGRKVDFVQDGSSWTAHVLSSTARVVVGDGVLVLEAEAPDAEGLARLEGALGNHLERFGQRRELTVAWQRSATAA